MVLAAVWPKTMASKVDLPDFLSAWLDSWGSKMLCQMRQAVKELDIRLTWPQFCSGSPGSTSSAALRLGTDCSGLDAPVYGLRALEIAHRHVFSCENNPAARAMIDMNCKPDVFFQDVLMSCEDAAPFCHLYVAGFSCKPFSTLHNKSKLLEEKDASIFKAVVRRIATLRPPSFLLENVEGIQRVMGEVTSRLKACGYLVVPKLMDPASLGEPLLRPRFYFIGLRKDVASVSQGQAEQVVNQLWSAMQKNSSGASLLLRLLPNDHPLVRESQVQRRERWRKAAAAGFPDPSCRTKWKEKHAAHASDDSSGQAVSACSPDGLFLHLPRQRDLWIKLSQKWVGQANQLTCDLSQSLGRARERVDGKLPTVTPRSHLIVAQLRRAIVPHEMLLLHGFPLHQMVFPSNAKGSDLASMGGNTMHILVVALATLMTLLLVDWGLPAAHRSGDASICPAVVEPPCTICSDAKLRFKEGQLEAKLRARFGLPGNTALAKACSKKGFRPQKRKTTQVQLKKKKKELCKKTFLQGTRWGR